VSNKYIIPPKQQYWAHYNKSTGVIRSASNEPTTLDEGSIEITYDEYKLFAEGQKKLHEHMVGYARTVDGTTQKTIIQIAEQLYGFRNNIFEWINKPPTRDTELTVTWNKEEKTWNFKLSKTAKKRIEDDLLTKTIFFIMLNNDFDFLIRNIVIDVSELVEKESITVPFESKIESKIEKISVSCQILFQGYGLKING
jgi:hypothetical protein